MYSGFKKFSVKGRPTEASDCHSFYNIVKLSTVSVTDVNSNAMITND